MKQTDRVPSAAVLRMEDVRQVGLRISRSKTWIFEAVRKGEFPAPRRLSPRCTRWNSREVDRWIEQQFAKEPT